MADQKQPTTPGAGIDATAKKAAKTIEPHQSEQKVTRSTEGSVETTTKEHK